MICLEICVDSERSAVAAEKGGAHRLELCANLEIGGTTPSAEIIKNVRRQVSIPLHVMIRPRGGDFCYSKQEFQDMIREIASAKIAGADGVVVGALLENRRIDVRSTRELVAAARPMKVTFHRAFDDAVEPLSALEDVILCGADRLLTSGQRARAIEGKELIGKLAAKAGSRIAIMAGAGITRENVRQIILGTKVREVHAARAVLNEAGTEVEPERVRALLRAATEPA